QGACPLCGRRAPRPRSAIPLGIIFRATELPARPKTAKLFCGNIAAGSNSAIHIAEKNAPKGLFFRIV
ncbi:MAG: hypothetical protein DBY30_06785, partial [Verrucomicrobia bacterium]